MKIIAKYLFQGLLLLAPFVVTVYVLFEVFTFLDSLIPKELTVWSWDDSAILVGDIPGLGLILLISLLVLIGFLGNTFIADPIIERFNKFLSRIPLLKVIYDSIKDLLSAFVGNKKKFNHPVIIREHENALSHKLGFITQEDVKDLIGKEGLCAVYLPHSLAFSGTLVFVDTKHVTPLNITSGEAMKFIVSGGIISTNELSETES